jgi:hypothetical protein
MTDTLVASRPWLSTACIVAAIADLIAAVETWIILHGSHTEHSKWV